MSGGVAPPRVTPPPTPGTYVVVLGLDRRVRIAVGSLGELVFEPGCHLYVGSARGPGGLAARIGRHLGVAARARWHVDHLRRVAEPVGVFWAGRSVEHDWADALASIRGARVVHRGFGSSDCRCPSHLVYRSTVPSTSTLRRHLGPVSGALV